MINHVIKRNGKKARFQPDKLNKLASWATEHNVSWSQIALNGLKKLSDGCTVQDIMQALIKACIDERSQSHLSVAGKIYVADLYKRVFAENDGKPIKLKHHLNKMYELGYYLAFDYSEEEFDLVDSWLKHENDYKLTYTQINQMESKYLVRNRVANVTYETPQFMYARIALAIFEKDPNRMYHIKNYLGMLQDLTLSLPSPNWSFIGTVNRTGASCCLYAAEDTDDSIAASEHITHKMTVAGAGLGNNLMIRSAQDSVKGGTIVHMGKLPYYRAQQGIAKSNKQGSRGGALTTYASILDPEIIKIIKARNPTTVSENKVDEIDYNIIFNNYFVQKLRAKGNQDWMLISIKVAPDLYKAFYSSNDELFAELYEKYAADETVPKTFVKARELGVMITSEQYETGRLYHSNASEMNTHTPFYDPIHSSNLCAEITLPTKPFHDTMALYEKFSSEYAYVQLEGERSERVFKDVDQAKEILNKFTVGDELEGRKIVDIKTKNEIALCNIAAINLHKDFTDEEYVQACYYALRTVDYVIYNSDYTFPNVEYTAQQRMSAGIGLMNFAYELARNGMFYSTKAGKKHAHFIAERHFYSLVKASLLISKERGNAPWIHKTKWVEGWLPIDTYNKGVDEIADFEYKYDWEGLRVEVKDNKGIAHSALCAHMPGESSSQNLNATNGLYPVRKGNVLKTDGSKTNIFIAPDWDNISFNYELAWEVPVTDLADHYGIFQKFTDQTISADYYRDFTVPGKEALGNKELLSDFVYKFKRGTKTQYYTNSKTNEADDDEIGNGAGCSSGACSL